LTLSRKLALTVAGVITLLATGLGTIPDTQANGSQAPSSALAALQQRRAQLIAELAAMQPNLRAAGGAVGSAEALFNAQQTKVLNEQKQLAALNASLLSLSSQLTSNDATVAQDKQQLAAITRATYETSGGDQVLAAVLSAPSFNQAMDELKSANQVSQQVLALVRRLAGADRAIHTEQTRIRGEAVQAGALEGQLAAQSDKFLLLLENRNTVFSGPGRSPTSTARSPSWKRDRTSAPGRAAIVSHTGTARTTSRPVAASPGSAMPRTGTAPRLPWDTRRAASPFPVRSSCSVPALTESAPSVMLPTSKRWARPRESLRGHSNFRR
jgi:peptidoglycan hydrolase CwlO-like protein